MSDDDLLHYGLPAAIILLLGLGYFFWMSARKSRLRQRIARITKRKTSVSLKSSDAMTLRKGQGKGLPVIGKIVANLPSVAALNARLERANMKITADIYATISLGGAILTVLLIMMIGKSPALGVLLGLVLFIFLPYIVIGIKGGKRIKKFLLLFPDAIDFIVRGLRSGLPVTESMNMVGGEMEEPLGSVFRSIGESVKLGMPLEKTLQDMSKKLDSTEFNFFVTSIILQRETGGNLSEILNNLSDVLRKRFMMRLKIKAMSSEAKASAIIVGALPFVVMIALIFVSPGYLNPLVDDPRGNMAAAGAATSLFLGIGIMIKMTRFEI